MKAWSWAGCVALGLGMMLMSYFRWERVDPEAPWSSGFLCVGHDMAQELAGGTTLKTRLRLLAADEMAEDFLRRMKSDEPEPAAALEAQLRPKLIVLPLDAMGLLVGRLREGRMPDPGKDELLAGSQSRERASLQLDGRTLQVVGVLEPSVTLFGDAFLAPAHPSLESLLRKDDPMVRPVSLISLNTFERHDRKLLTGIEEACSAGKSTLVVPSVRPERRAFLVYLLGQALFLFGGTGLLFGLYRRLSRASGRNVLSDPLREIAARPRLFWGLHLVYFGLFVVGAFLIYEFPILQKALLMAIRGELSSKGNGPLAVAGRAYGSGNFAYAALVTFLINFHLGSLAVITLPSLIVPGSGVLMAIVRAATWGFLLGPADVSLAASMLAHTGTLLLEGEGYILATFFGLLVPVYLFGRDRSAEKPGSNDELHATEASWQAGKDTFGSRFKRALSINLKGSVLVAIVLAVAACYEAVEVITMAGL